MSKDDQQDPIETDWYTNLGLERTATFDEIRIAYLKLAKLHHPDLNPDDLIAEEKFKAISEAYSVLSDPGLRRYYHFKSGQLPGDSPADSNFDWHQTASTGRYRVVAFCVLGAVVLGSTIYGARAWLDKQPTIKVAAYTGRAARQPIENTGPAKINKLIDEDNLKDHKPRETFAKEAVKDSATSRAKAKTRTKKPEEAQDKPSENVVVNSREKEVLSKLPQETATRPAIDTAMPDKPSPPSHGDDSDFDTNAASKFVQAESDEDEPAISVRSAEGGAASVAVAEPSDEAAENALLSKSEVQDPPPLPLRKPRRVTRQTAGGRERTKKQPRRLTLSRQRDPRRDFDPPYARLRDPVAFWRPGRWYWLDGRRCKITFDGRFKCRQRRSVRDRILRRRFRRTRHTYRPPEYWVRGRWYFYRGRLCKVKLNGVFKCARNR